MSEENSEMKEVEESNESPGTEEMEESNENPGTEEVEGSNENNRTSIFVNSEGDFSSQFSGIEREAMLKATNRNFNSTAAFDSTVQDASTFSFESSANSSDKYKSYARSGGFGAEFAALNIVDHGRNRRESFKDQLLDLDEFILEEEEEEEEDDGGATEPKSRRGSHRLSQRRPSKHGSVISVRSGVAGEARIEEKLFRRSSVNRSFNANLLGLNEDLSKLIDDVMDDDEEGSKDDKAEGEKEEKVDEELDDPPFESCYEPSEMRCLALVAHNHMKPSMKDFVLSNKNILKKFKLTGTNTTMTMLKEVFGNDPKVEYGPTCTSGPLGGDAELVAIMCSEHLGGCVFFQDPMSAHPHVADIECLVRQANVHNVLIMPNPATAFAVMTTLRIALRDGKAELIPSFFKTLASPSVAEYKIRQAKVVERNKGKKKK